MSGYIYDGISATDGWIVAHDVSSGGTLAWRAWEAVTRGPDGRAVLAGALGVSPDGSTLYQGAGLGPAGTLRRETFSMFAFDAGSGSSLWETHHVPEGGSAVNGLMEIVATDDRVYAAGLGKSAEGAFAMHTLALDPGTGELAWTKLRKGLGVWALGNGTIAVGGDRVFVTAQASGDAPSAYGDGWTVAAYDAATGTEAWALEAFDPGPRLVSYLGFYPAIAATPTGDRVFVTGPRGQHHVAAATTVAYSGETGAQMWSARWSGGSSYPSTLTTSRDGRRVFVTGTTNDVEAYPLSVDGHTPDLMTIAYQS